MVSARDFFMVAGRTLLSCVLPGRLGVVFEKVEVGFHDLAEEGMAGIEVEGVDAADGEYQR